MLNRALQVKMVKTSKDESNTTENDTVDFELKVDTITNAFEKIIKRIGYAAIGYVVIDTARRIVIEKATQEK